jgi:hypothetical protein
MFARLFDELLEALNTWATWDTITSLSNYRFINERLWSLLRRVEKVQFRSVFVQPSLISEWYYQQSTLHPSRCDAGHQLQRLLSLDAIAICASLAIIIQDHASYRAFLSHKDTQAQSLLNLIQEVFIHSMLSSRTLIFKSNSC